MNERATLLSAETQNEEIRSRQTSPIERAMKEAPVEAHGCAPLQGKTCCRCGKTKILTHFYPRPDSKDGHESLCKDCRSRAKRARRQGEKAAQTLNFSILAEVAEVQERRQRDYGDPISFFGRASQLAGLMTGKELSPEDCVRVLMAVKLAREAFRPGHEHRVDLAGYTAILDQLQK